MIAIECCGHWPMLEMAYRMMYALHIITQTCSTTASTCQTLHSTDSSTNTCNMLLMQVALQRYGVQSNQLRMFLHYQPSYYHLHVHVTHVSLEHAGLLAGKAHLLDDVIGECLTCLLCNAGAWTEPCHHYGAGTNALWCTKS